VLNVSLAATTSLKGHRLSITSVTSYFFNKKTFIDNQKKKGTRQAYIKTQIHYKNSGVK